MEKKIIENKVCHYNISCNERFSQYLRFMNEDVEKGYNLRCRYLYKIYQVGVSPLYTKDERKDVVNRLLKNASEQTDENNRALDLICAYKIVQYNKLDIDVPNFRVSETLWLKDTGRNSEFPKSILEKMSEERRKKTLSFIAHMGPNEEILNLYNVAIQRDWFASFNPMKTEVDDGIYDGMNEIEAFNRKNCNAVKCLIILLLYNGKIAEEIEFFRTVFEGKEPKEYHKRITDIPDLNLLEDPGDKCVEYYWITLKSNPELFENDGDKNINDLETTTYKITMFDNGFDSYSEQDSELRGVIRIWEKAEDDWKSIAFSDSWCSWVDLFQLFKAAMVSRL